MTKVTDKIMLTAAAGLTAVSTVSTGVMPLFAQENTNVAVVNTDEQTSTSKKEELEKSLRNAQFNLDIAKQNMDKIQKKLDTSKTTYEDLSKEQITEQTTVNNEYNALYNDQNAEYQALLQQVANLEAAMASKQAELDAYTKKGRAGIKKFGNSQSGSFKSTK